MGRCVRRRPGGAVMRSGAAWDAVSLVALAAPAAGVLAPLAGRSGRDLVVRIGRWGSLAAVGLWTVLVAGDVRPTLGSFDPDRLTMAVLAATALVGALLVRDPAPDELPSGVGTALDTAPSPAAPARWAAASSHGEAIDPVAALAPIAAGLVVLVLGLVDGPTSLTAGSAALWTLLASLAASIAAVALRGSVLPPAEPIARRASREGLVTAWTGWPVARFVAVLGPAALLLALRAGRLVPGGGLPGFAAVAGPLAAVLAGATAVAARRHPAGALVTGAFLVAAALLAPVPAARPVAGVVAAGAFFAATATERWSPLALAPGLAALFTVAADVPAPAADTVPHAVWALGLAAAAIGLVLGTVSGHVTHPALEGRVAAAGLTAWLVLAPDQWSWADPPAELLEPWGRAAATGATGLFLGALCVATLPPLRHRQWPAVRRRGPAAEPLDSSAPGLPG